MWKKVSFVVMTLFLAVTGVMNCGNVSYAQKVWKSANTFPDRALRKIIIANFKESRIETDDVKEIVIGSYTDGCDEFDDETVLNIESLKGLELFTNLEKLVIIPRNVAECWPMESRTLASEAAIRKPLSPMFLLMSPEC